MSYFQEDRMREEELYKIIFESGIVCHFCRLSEDVLHCDILYDQTECKKHLCTKCFEKYGRDHCQADHKYQDHYFKKNLKLSHKIGIVDQATKIFQRQHKIRNNPQYQNLDFDLQNLMSYLYMNPTLPEQRVTFNSIDSAVKQALGDKKKQDRKLNTQTTKTKKASYINRTDHRTTENGIETCGYDRSYEKGINLVMRAFEKKTPPSIDRVIESKNKSTDFKKDSNDLSKS